ncbi:MAG: F0F1 ATP synthase subunit delta [Pseudomonadales bacterium]|jgi:F-type H+-transporting ATPase subunit delta|nr:F0F1 ATP synthase subunit delta [Pseudomonadales bacterium]MDP6471412.1 F0F1 ATP synthase subunit delta [Pseudomonadales bacterium]MDP6828581.1 F0F1 ATP synthase subunit delta [Pseudomonadales bacterium]MDP6972005.1 F0F1 ATP synthase subunit delta [Pseudomonadales bacterium]|tara:strand:- start:3771 stop:4310 length:540 start_codon:yes stop_codon:yes gene_type:complete
MAEAATLARPYANAIFQIASDNDYLGGWSRMLGFLGVVAADEGMGLLLSSPDVSGPEKAHKLAEVCGDELNERARNLLQVLAANQRLDLLPEIALQYEALKAASEQSLDVEVLSAYPLSQSETETLKNALVVKFDKEVTVTSSVDQSLLGGAVIRAGDMVIDGSVRGKLEKLAEMLQRA